MEIDRNGLEILDEEECLLLLGRVRFGRVAFTHGALPVILPVHFGLLDGDPVFRTSEGAKLDAARHGEVVCLEADSADWTYHAGWSVLAIGRCERLQDPDELARARRLPLRPWTPGGGDEYVRIRAEVLSGRRIGVEARRPRVPARASGQITRAAAPPR